MKTGETLSCLPQRHRQLIKKSFVIFLDIAPSTYDLRYDFARFPKQEARHEVGLGETPRR